MLPFFAKVGLACETIDRDEERDGKQQEIVEKTNTKEAESVLVVYHVSCVNACVQLYVTLMLPGFVTVVYRLLDLQLVYHCSFMPKFMTSSRSKYLE